LISGYAPEMQVYVVVIWNFHGRGGAKAALAMLQRCDLRHEAQQEVLLPEGDSDTFVRRMPGSFGSVRLMDDDPRLPLLLKELKAARVSPIIRNERDYSKKDLEAQWLKVRGCTTMVLAGNRQGQKWNFKRACKVCGVGAVPVPPLIVQVQGRPPKQGWSVSVPCGLVVVSADLAKILVEAKLTGFVVEPVQRASTGDLDERFRWLRIPCDWPAPLEESGCRVVGACAGCKRPALRGESFCFERVPNKAKDFNAWQSTELPEERVSGVVNRPTGASPMLIISQSAYRTLKGAGVKSLKCWPVDFKKK